MSKAKHGIVPAERNQTARRAIAAALRENALTAREIGVLCALREREVAPHLEHLARSLARSGERLLTLPARCVGCDFEFEQRRRPTRPSRCPACKSERIRPATFRIEPAR